MTRRTLTVSGLVVSGEAVEGVAAMLSDGSENGRSHASYEGPRLWLIDADDGLPQRVAYIARYHLIFGHETSANHSPHDRGTDFPRADDSDFLLQHHRPPDGIHCRQNKGSAQELQRLFGSVKMQRPSVCRRPSSVRYKENLVPFSNRFEGPPSIGVVGTKSEDFAILALSFP